MIINKFSPILFFSNHCLCACDFMIIDAYTSKSNMMEIGDYTYQQSGVG